ncbi:MAG: AbrB/MazE/SpoVT family DNA-binding domain-containing protein [Deltaproteobacteria bacterium]|nr:AbrB/MazE/SpoVT family DNA-binding domain-containing protein [Deltaproteobacteria bacterium]MBW2016672.1 AbrB/MazE/SpoVT family DNA-binding domain-containing protein [Deltaproteobacteria bacterium]MBW2129159.1 AbrB/MazE/SpoVT family DNA-binding domain-containing protein [Deltaproteobacteria bacterium]MBW2304190.1 AbrB/MazE/SpoVT family DNA-binding domain-containing protein [Deltaproteobacteria bacterium]
MKIEKRGQVAIPKNIREKYGFLSNIEVYFMPEENGERTQLLSPVDQVYGISQKIFFQTSCPY